MERWIGIGVASLALLVSLFNVWTLKGFDARLDALEGVGPPAGKSPAKASGRKGKARENGGKLAQVDLKDPEVREAARDRLVELTSEKQAKRADKAEQARVDLTTEVEAFALEQDLDDDTVMLVLGELEARSDAFHTVREDVRTGVISRMDGRQDLKAELEASDAALLDILGEERFQILDERLWGEREGGRPR